MNFRGGERSAYLDAIAAVHLHVARVIFPDDTELQDALRDLRDGESLFVFRLPLEKRAESGSDFVEGLISHEDEV